jgi:hypothetical protein
LLAASETPFFDTARALQEEGVPPATRIEMQWADSGTVSLRSTVGEAASLTVSGHSLRFREYVPFAANRFKTVE